MSEVEQMKVTPKNPQDRLRAQTLPALGSSPQLQYP